MFLQLIGAATLADIFEKELGTKVRARTCYINSREVSPSRPRRNILLGPVTNNMM